jgi:hypothetical protein
LAKQLNKRVDLYATAQTFERWQKVGDANRIIVDTKLQEIEEIDDLFLLLQKKSEEDLIIFCSARRGGVSYSPAVDSFTAKLEKAYPTNDMITVYPSQNSLDNIYVNYDDFDPAALTKGVEAIQKIGKEVGSIFKKS